MFTSTVFILLGISTATICGKESDKYENVKLTFFIDEKQIKELESLTNEILHEFTSKTPGLSGNHNVNQIGKRICGEIEVILDEFGLINSSINEKSRVLKSRSFPTVDLTPLLDSDSIRYELFSLVNLIPLAYELSSTFNDHYRKNNYLKKGYTKSELALPSFFKPKDYDLQILTIADRLSNFIIGIIDCLDTNKTDSKNNFNFKTALGNILKHPPEVTRKITKNRLRRTAPKNPLKSKFRSELPSEFDATLCQALSNDMSRQFKLCLKELKRIEFCVKQKLRKPKTNPSMMRKLDGIVKGIFNYNLNDLKNNKTYAVSYDWSFWDWDKYVKLYFTDYSNYMKSSGLKSSVSKLKNDISQSEIGSELMKELDLLKRIYDEGVDKEKRLLKMSKTNKNSLKNYRKVSKTLSSLKDILTQILFTIISKINVIATAIESFLSSISLTSNKLSLRNNVHSLKCLQNLIEKVGCSFDKDIDKVEEGTTLAPSYSDFWEDFGEFDFENSRRSFASTSKPLNDFIRSMKQLTRSPTMKQPSTIVMLANTFLLATIFYECIAMLAGVMYPGPDKNEVPLGNPVEIDSEFFPNPPEISFDQDGLNDYESYPPYLPSEDDDSYYNFERSKVKQATVKNDNSK